MTTVNVTEARANLYKLIDDASASHEPVVITGKRGNAVLLAEDDWNAINETLYLLSVPGMRESIIEGMQENLDETSTALKWWLGRFTTQSRPRKMRKNSRPLASNPRQKRLWQYSKKTLGKIHPPSKSSWAI